MKVRQLLSLMLALALMISGVSPALAVENQSGLDDITFTFFMPDAEFNIPPDDNPIANQIYEATGVRIAFDVPAADPEERLLMLMTGNELPDVIDFADLGNNAIMKQYIKAGKLLRLNDLLQEYAPKAWETAWPALLENVADENGDIWYLPYWYYFSKEDLLPEAEYGFNVHTAYFDENGYDKIPKTLADLEQVLLSVKETRPDLTPIAYALGAEGQLEAIISSGAAANGLNYTNNLVLKDGTVQYFTDVPEMKEYFRFLNRLNLEGLVDPESPVLSTEMLKQRCVAGRVWAYIGYGWEINSEVGVYEDSIGSLDRMITIWPTADTLITHGTYAPYTFNLNKSGIALTVDCKDPERFIQYYEYLNSEEGRLSTYGVINYDFEGENTVENTEGYNFVARKDMQFLEGRPYLEPTEWQSKMWGEDENWWWTNGLYCYGYFTYAECNYPNGKWDMLGAGDVSIWWDENTTRINNELGVTGQNYWDTQRDMAVDVTDLAALELDDDSQEYLISIDVRDTYNKYIPRCIMAQSEEEFETIWTTMTDELEQIGLRQMMDTYQSLYAEREAD